MNRAAPSVWLVIPVLKQPTASRCCFVWSFSHTYSSDPLAGRDSVSKYPIRTAGLLSLNLILHTRELFFLLFFLPNHSRCNVLTISDFYETVLYCNLLLCVAETQISTGSSGASVWLRAERVPALWPRFPVQLAARCASIV